MSNQILSTCGLCLLHTTDCCMVKWRMSHVRWARSRVYMKVCVQCLPFILNERPIAPAMRVDTVELTTVQAIDVFFNHARSPKPWTIDGGNGHLVILDADGATCATFYDWDGALTERVQMRLGFVASTPTNDA